MTHRGRPPHGWGVYGGAYGQWQPRPRRVVRVSPAPPPRSSAWLIASGLGTMLVTFVSWGLLAIVVMAGIDASPLLLIAVVGALVYVNRRKRRTRRLFAAGTAPLPFHPAPRPVPPRRDAAWSRAHTRFTALRAEYAAHECDPMAVLRLPALSDVTVPSTARFVDAFAEAQALETDAFPPESHAAAFVHAVERAERAWRAARDAAERIRLSNLSPAERHAVERVIKLLTTARDSDNDSERLAAYSRARAELAKLDQAGVIHMPRTALAALEAKGRGQLPA